MKKTLLALAISQAMVAVAYANTAEVVSEVSESAAASPEVEQTADLGDIEVRASSFSQQVGTQKITAEQIKRMPTTNGNITELLKSNPNVSFSHTAGQSISAGEIKPDEVSFHGEKFYNNNFMIDGISNNDNINPLGESVRADAPLGTNVYDLPAGGTQSFWINTKLLKNVEVFDSNVSAKYGNFTGGVVNAEMKDPDLTKTYGSVAYRTTRGSWAKYHIERDDDVAFNNASRISYQPEFTKNSYDLILNQPLSDNTGILFAYNRTESDIRFVHPVLVMANGDRVRSDQKRLNETYMLKGIHFAENGDMWRATFLYSPHSSKFPKTNVLNGNLTNTGGGYSALLDWEKQLDSVKMKTVLSFKQSGTVIEHDEDVYRRYVVSPNIEWISNNNYALYGGLGKYSTINRAYTLKQDFTFTEFDLGSTVHKPIIGWVANLSEAEYRRDHDTYQYYYTRNPQVICGSSNECITGDQYANEALMYPARQAKAKDNSFAAYIEDNIRWKRLELNLGLRADYNQFLGNFDIGPRLSASVDLLGDRKSFIFGGYSHYYGQSMLAYKLRETIGNNVRFYRNSGTEYSWAFRSEGNGMLKYSDSKVKTPYSEEYVLGFSKKWDSFSSTLKWVHRNGLNNFTRVYDQERSAYVLANEGWSQNDSITLEMGDEKLAKNEYVELGWKLGAKYAKNRTNFKNYDASEDEDFAMYHNQFMRAQNLSAADFSPKWQAALDVNLNFPKIGLSWDQRLIYLPARKQIEATTATYSCQYDSRNLCGSYSGTNTVATEYVDVSYGKQLILDWRFLYKLPTFGSQFIELSLDVNNVFDTKAKTKTDSSGTTRYKMGRNFWAGVSYNW